MLELLAINIGFIKIRFVDILDIILVGLLLYQLYKLLKGSLAFNIFIGLAFLFGIWFLVRALEMRMLSNILNQFVGLGVIALVIVFQPEIRRFLLLLGKGGRFAQSELWQKYVLREEINSNKKVTEIGQAVKKLASTKTGALIVLTETSQLQFVVETGVVLNADLSATLLESIFEDGGALHDGAVIIYKDKIIAASCTLPVSADKRLTDNLGTRHKAGLGISEKSDAVAIIVSEESGQIAIAENGKLLKNLSNQQLNVKLKTLFESQKDAK